MKVYQLANDVSTYGDKACYWMVVTDDDEIEIAGPFADYAEASRVASLSPFDDYEVHGCDTGYTTDKDGVRHDFTEQCEDDIAQFFSLYGHLTTGGVECLGDFKTRKGAEDALVRIIAPLKEAAAIISRLQTELTVWHPTGNDHAAANAFVATWG